MPLILIFRLLTLFELTMPEINAIMQLQSITRKEMNEMFDWLWDLFG